MAWQVALVSGGLKGSVAAARYAPGSELALVHVDFGQASWPAEVKAVETLADAFPEATIVSLDLTHVSQLETQLLNDGRGPGRRAEHVAAKPGRVGPRPLPPAALTGLMPAMIGVGLQCALRIGAGRLIVGLSRFAGSHTIGFPEPDGRPQHRREFIHAANVMVDSLPGLRTQFRIEAPLIDAAYDEIVKLAVHFKLPIAQLRSCETGAASPCGTCESCRARSQAFSHAGLVDPQTTGKG